MPTRITLIWNQNKVSARVRAAAEQRLRQVGPQIVQRFKADLSAPGPSPPGTPPGKRSGTLQASIRGRVTHPARNIVQLTILGQRLGLYLERAKTFKRRRPFIGPVLGFASQALRRWFPGAIEVRGRR